MRVVPVGTRAIGYFEVVHVLPAVPHGEARMTVGQFGYVESVPVDDRRLTELIAEMDSNPLPASNANHWPEVRVVDRLRGCRGPAKNAPRELPHIRRRARQQRHGAWGSGQFEFDIGRCAWQLGERGTGGEQACTAGRGGQGRDGEKAEEVSTVHIEVLSALVEPDAFHARTRQGAVPGRRRRPFAPRWAATMSGVILVVR